MTKFQMGVLAGMVLGMLGTAFAIGIFQIWREERRKARKELK
jgi:uncharacterized membrane protein YeaQ/YmgE (transglycosylase-associated protein family)